MFGQERLVQENDAQQDRADGNEERYQQDVGRARTRKNPEIQDESERRRQRGNTEDRTDHRQAWHWQCPGVIDQQRNRQDHDA